MQAALHAAAAQGHARRVAHAHAVAAADIVHGHALERDGDRGPGIPGAADFHKRGVREPELEAARDAGAGDVEAAERARRKDAQKGVPAPSVKLIMVRLS